MAEDLLAQQARQARLRAEAQVAIEASRGLREEADRLRGLAARLQREADALNADRGSNPEPPSAA